jgi:SNF2 family DNA or RNA helicase
MLREEQIDLRKQRARAEQYRIDNLGNRRVFSDYRVVNPRSGGEYTVTIRGFDITDRNACTCPDFRANTLGTCKHIEAVLAHLEEEQSPAVRKKKASVTRPEITLSYRNSVRLMLLLPPRTSDRLTQLARRFFDEQGLWSGQGRYEELIAAIEAVPETVTVQSDALDYVDREVGRAELLRKEQAWLAELEAGTLQLPLLSVPLYDYQMRGALFLACRERCILGDDMGLGKTVQAIAAVELLTRERGIQRVLVVAPASVKYQWEGEIQRFTQQTVQVIEGRADDRQEQYQQPSFYKLVNYEQVVRDLEEINAWKPDVVILDEAQRIKNWESKTSRSVKKLQSRYAMVLTGTPLENKLEELYSIVQFVDEHHFGPAFQFLHDHRIVDAEGNLLGYRNLDAIRAKLAPIFLRRTRAEVLTQLPPRTDSTIYLELAPEQQQLYAEQRTALARLLARGHHSEIDRKRILACLNNLRMICNSTFLFDKETRIAPKLDEFALLVPELLQGDAHKIVVFSQWEVMIQEAATVLERLGIGFAVLHGGLSGHERRSALETFQHDESCRVFLSTDAGASGLNLQRADSVVNLELPWNPAVLEQRIARVHRMGQSNPVRVVHLITRDTIEERVLRTLEEKQGLFEGLFHGDDDELNLARISVSTFTDSLRELLGEAIPSPERPVAAKRESAPPPLPAPSPMLAGTLTSTTVQLVRSLRAWSGSINSDPATITALTQELRSWLEQLESSAPANSSADSSPSPQAFGTPPA